MRIAFALSARGNSAVAAKAFKPGDLVVYELPSQKSHGTQKEFTIEEVSSISEDGMVYFKNPRRGIACAWAVYLRGATPDEIWMLNHGKRKGGAGSK